MGARFHHKVVVCAVTLVASSCQTLTLNIDIPRQDDTYDKVVREPGIKRGSPLDTLHLLWGQGNVQRRDVFLELFDFPATNDREHVGELMQMVRNSNYKCSSNLGY